jgi:hypothetical protein
LLLLDPLRCSDDDELVRGPNPGLSPELLRCAGREDDEEEVWDEGSAGRGGNGDDMFQNKWKKVNSLKSPESGMMMGCSDRWSRFDPDRIHAIGSGSNRGSIFPG